MNPTALPPHERAGALDAADPLRSLRDRFVIPRGPSGDPAVYLAGHSLGLQPRAVRVALESVLDDWAELGVQAWTDPATAWVHFDQPLAAASAAVVGARESEVAVAGSLTGNLHAMLASFYRPEGKRTRILMEAGPFPSDRYAARSQARMHGLDPDAVVFEADADPGTGLVDEDRLCATIEREADTIALVLLGGVNYYTGQAFDLERICRTARSAGCVIGLDLAHAAGNVPLRLHDDAPDFAVWCGYKYLNGGPGAPAAYFVPERHHDAFDGPRLAGWWGHRLDSRFRMPPVFEPESGAEGWRISTPSIIALAPLSASLALFTEAGIPALRTKSERLTGFLADLLRERLAKQVEVVTPERRGAQLSLRIRDRARAVFDALVRADVVCDWREPDAIRVAPVPLYNSFADVARFVRRLERAVAQVAGEEPLGSSM